MGYENYGNENLKPLAVSGDQAAIDELARRGNTLDEKGQLVKVFSETIRNRDAKGNLISENVIKRTVADGRLISKTIDDIEVPITSEGLN